MENAKAEPLSCFLGSQSQDKLDELLAEDDDLVGPISLMLFVHPVKASDGFVYEKQSFEQLRHGSGVSPMTTPDR